MTQEWHGQSEQGQSWFSDEALRKQAELQRRKEAREEIPAELFYGIWEPRVLPEEDEVCACCGWDARVQIGGYIIDDAHWCAICVARNHHLK